MSVSHIINSHFLKLTNWQAEGYLRMGEVWTSLKGFVFSLCLLVWASSWEVLSLAHNKNKQEAVYTSYYFNSTLRRRLPQSISGNY